ncbi:MAG: alpha/beta fold hydrolase [Armatimonadetes bacterium]|nr:alpha/beta fold hydrolase [Armatimonadota bacterium]
MRLLALVLLTAALCGALAAPAQDGPLRQRIKERLRQHAGERNPGQSARIVGLDVSFWLPPGGAQKAPLVVFSHGFHGNSLQSTFLMEALAQDGYVVVAPNHKDAVRKGSHGSLKPELPLTDPGAWTDATFKDRRDDIVALLQQLQADPEWDSRVDWSRLALAGHSLGGYTVLGLAGGWPSWRIPGVKAVLALSPYANPLVQKGQLGALGIPVMYQTGTWDKGVEPFLKRDGGAYEKTSAPAYLIDFQGAGHFAWTDLRRDFQPSITFYCRAFLDKHLFGDKDADPLRRRSDVSVIWHK